MLTLYCENTNRNCAEEVCCCECRFQKECGTACLNSIIECEYVVEDID